MAYRKRFNNKVPHTFTMNINAVDYYRIPTQTYRILANTYGEAVRKAIDTFHSEYDGAPIQCYTCTHIDY